KLWAIASVVHSFVNAAEGQPTSVEKAEIREFKSGAEWTNIMEKQGFYRVSNQALVLKDDPTQNAMMIFAKKPQTKNDLEQIMNARKDCNRPKEGSRYTWIEWGNVNFSKEYANFVQNHHSYAFNYIGYLRQHWKHFFYFVKESFQDEDVTFCHSLFNDGMAMNLF